MEKVLEKKDYIIFISVALFYFIFRLFFLNTPPKEMFDEVYYIPASRDYLEFKPDSNWVHPPLAKMIIALFAYITPFLGFMKWRVASAFFGALMVGISYPFAMVLFKNRMTAFVAMFLMFFDFLTFVQSGITTLDIFLVGFMTLSAFCTCIYVFRAEESNILPIVISSIFAGLASACKWSGSFSFFFLIFCISCLKDFKKENNFFILRTCFLSLSVYLIAFFIPYCYCFLVGDTFNDLYLRFVNILKFQYGDGWKHSYLSYMWQWILMVRPCWYFFKSNNDLFAGINSMGNPFFWWSFLLFFVSLVYRLFKSKDEESNKIGLFLVFGYCFSFIFWVFSNRPGFFYYIYPAVIWMSLISSYFLSLLHKKYGNFIICLYLSVIFLSFVLYFPILSGIPIDKKMFYSLLFLKSWI